MSAVQPLIISYSGIRGVAGEALTAEVVRRFARAFAGMIARRRPDGAPRPTVLLGRDTRPSGPELLRGAIAGLAPSARLVDLGVVPTPTLQLALDALGADAGVCITASHNPLAWNGLKLFLAPDHTVLDGDQMRELRALAGAEPEGAAPGDDAAAGPGDAAAAAPAIEDRHADAVRLHLERVAAQIDVARVRARRFRVALDSGGGAGAEPTERLLRELGCEVHVVREPREIEPIPEHLGALCRAVRDGGCDLGLAQDLDADRLALVTERGEAPGEELTLVFALEHLLRRFPDGERVVVKNLATTCAVDDLAARHGAALIETPVGEVNLSRALLAAARRGQIAFGGEGNGGVIFPPVSAGRDSLLGAALVLDSLAGQAAPLSARLAALPRYHGAKLRVPLPPGAFVEPLLARVEAAFPGATVSRLDGLRLRFADRSWLIVRASNTEPILRVVLESSSAAWVGETARAVTQALAAA